MAELPSVITPYAVDKENASTHWRATCNFPTDGVDYRDYWRVSLQNLDLTVDNKKGDHCLFSEHVNVRGNECTNCKVWCIYSSTVDLHMDRWGGTGVALSTVGQEEYAMRITLVTTLATTIIFVVPPP